MNKNKGCLSIIIKPFGFGKDEDPYTIQYTESDEDNIEKFPYHIRDDFLSRAEISFFLVLKNMTKGYLAICPKVSLAELFYVDNPRQNYGSFGKIRQKRVDFLICEPQTMQPKFAIELDDQSHNRSDRQERDQFVDKVFQVAGLPLIHIPAQAEYNTNELGVLIKSVLKLQNPQPKAAIAQDENPLEIYIPPRPNFCPKCGGNLVLREARQGQNKGKKFLGCRNYPKCQHLVPIDENIDNLYMNLQNSSIRDG